MNLLEKSDTLTEISLSASFPNSTMDVDFEGTRVVEVIFEDREFSVNSEKEV